MVTARHLMPLLNPASDAELLRHFVETRDETAFAEIVRRHGGLVRGVAHRLLVDTDMAHDVFQATFLLLAKKAKHGNWGRTVGPWLYQVACRVANKARVRRARQSIRFAGTVDAATTATQPIDHLIWTDVRKTLDEELSRLPAIYRDPLLLCYLEGLSRDEAADALGCTLIVLKGRLERGRTALRRGLESRGLTLSVGLAATFMHGSSISAKSCEELARLAAGSVLGVPIPASLRHLIQMGSSGTAMKAVTLAGVLTVLSLGMAISLSEPGHRSDATDPKPTNPADAKSEKAAETDTIPLPAGAIARLGSTSFRHSWLSDFVVLKDGKSVLTAGNDGILRYWNLNTGHQFRKVALEGRKASFRVVSLSPDGKLFAATEGNRLDIWDADTGNLLKSFPSLKITASQFLYFSPNGDYLTIGTFQRTASLLAWKTDLTERPIPLPKTQIGGDSTFHACFTPDSSRIVAGGGFGEKLCVFEVKDLSTVMELQCNAATSIVTRDGKTLVVNSLRQGVESSDVCLFDMSTGQEKGRFPLPESYFRLDVSPDGRTLACGWSDQSCIVDLATGKVRHKFTGRPLEVTFTPDGNTLVARAGPYLRIWNASTGQERNPQPGNFGHDSVLAVSPDGRVLASADWMSQEVTLWDLKNGRILHELPVGGNEKRYICDLAFSPNGKLLFAAQGKGFIQSWNPTTGEEKASIQLTRKDGVAAGPRDLDSLSFYHFHVSTDGRCVTALERWWSRHVGPGPASPTTFTRLGTWDLSTGKVISEYEYPEELRRWIWIGKSSTALLGNNGLSILKQVPGKFQFNISEVAPRGPIAASPDGRLVAGLVSIPDGKPETKTMRVWEAATGRPISTIQVSKADYLALGSDDRTLVYAESRTLHILDLATGRERGRIQSDVNVAGLILTPDGRSAITPLDDGTGLVWNLTAFPTESLADKATVQDIAGWWKDLLSNDAGIAYAAVWRLSAAPPATVLNFLQENLKPAPRPNPNEVSGLVKDLGDDDFKTREKATKRLSELGPAVAPALRDALAGSESPEVRKRAKELLDKIAGPLQTPEGVRRTRAIAVLERLGSAEARKLLTDLASGPSGYIETDAAVSALERLSQTAKMP
jgi:RNA polymerase sigma factor (sigma-70 family)